MGAGRERRGVQASGRRPLLPGRRRLPQPDLLRAEPGGLRIPRRQRRRRTSSSPPARACCPRTPASIDVYDARVGGGFPPPQPPPAGLRRRSLPGAARSAQRPDPCLLGLRGRRQRGREEGQEEEEPRRSTRRTPQKHKAKKPASKTRRAGTMRQQITTLARRGGAALALGWPRSLLRPAPPSASKNSIVTFTNPTARRRPRRAPIPSR